MAQKQLSIGILLFPGFELLDVFGPAEVFAATCYKGKAADDDSARPFNVVYLAQRAEPVLAGNRGNARIIPDATLDAHPPLDIVLVPGGLGTRTIIDNISDPANQKLIDWLREMDSQVQLMTSVCTGAVLLANTGLLCNHSATTNLNAFAWVTGKSPKDINWIKGVRWVDEDQKSRYITSAGVSAGMDMACHLVHRLLGHEVARETVQRIEYCWEEDDPKRLCTHGGNG
jgi:putative intracellular protease/amidase